MHFCVISFQERENIVMLLYSKSKNVSINFLSFSFSMKNKDASRDVKPSIHGKKENARFERTLRILIRKKQLGSGTTKTKMVINKDI